MPGNNQFNFLYGLRTPAFDSAQYWEKTELMIVPALTGIIEPFCEVNLQADPYMIECFGTASPAADYYLLHSAPGWSSNTHPVPLILIHGAALDATSYTNIWNMGYPGLQQQLVKLGHRVFSLTFPHSHGDNFYQAQMIADAVNEICRRCRVDKVNLVTHSKGGIAARIYLSNLITPGYRGDVDHLIMLGVPNLGTDFAFRNPTVSYMIFMAAGNGAIAWDQIFVMGGHIDVSQRSIYKDGAFPGQSQILFRWDGDAPLDITQQDWWTTYHGGNGYFSHSRGIDNAMGDGGYLIQRLEKAGLQPDIKISVLAGSSSLFTAVSLQNSLIGDGVVFADSALNTDGMLTKGAILQGKKTMPLNHIELLYHPRAARWVDWQLKSG